MAGIDGKAIATALAFAALFGGATMAQDTEEVGSLIAGTWSQGPNVEITFVPCEVGECGLLTKLIIPDHIYAEKRQEIDALGAENIEDDFNPDPKLRDRKVMGLSIVTLSRKISPTRYQGRVYNPEDGNTYDGTVELIDYQTLRLTGCAFLILCQTQEWHRIPEEVVAAARETEDDLPGNVAVWHPPEPDPELEPEAEFVTE